MSDTPAMPNEIAKYVDPYYVASFGEFPKFPRERMALGAEVSPQFTLAAEELRKQALYSDVLDKKTSQLVALALLISRASELLPVSWTRS
jgi:alkylhydroperoxidase/carboxymuconolactone decarboxylase family protein YurZ